MTINKVIEKLGRLKPSAVQDQDIADWLLELDGRLFAELGMPEDTVRPKSWPEDGDMELCAGAPYEELYVYYALGMVEFYRREYSEYNNSMQLFNDLNANFRRAWRRAHEPEGAPLTGVWP